eukprot:10843224-Alexandrium_andersonii.AAC.1
MVEDPTVREARRLAQHGTECALGACSADAYGIASPLLERARRGAMREALAARQGRLSDRGPLAEGKVPAVTAQQPQAT